MKPQLQTLLLHPMYGTHKHVNQNLVFLHSYHSSPPEHQDIYPYHQEKYYYPLISKPSKILQKTWQLI